MNVIIIKTIIGEEILAGLVSETHVLHEDCMTISRPRVVHIQQLPDGKMTPSLVPWLILDPDNKSVPLFEQGIASIVTAPYEVAKSYMSSVSGIVLSS